MVLISVASDFCLGISNTGIGPKLTIKYKFMAPCSLYFSQFPPYNHDSTDSLESFICLVIPIKRKKQISQGHTGIQWRLNEIFRVRGKYSIGMPSLHISKLHDSGHISESLGQMNFLCMTSRLFC